jgi:hypothetical protein
VPIPETEIDSKFLEDVDYVTEELFKAVEDILAQQGGSHQPSSTIDNAN